MSRIMDQSFCHWARSFPHHVCWPNSGGHFTNFHLRHSTAVGGHLVSFSSSFFSLCHWCFWQSSKLLNAGYRLKLLETWHLQAQQVFRINKCCNLWTDRKLVKDWPFHHHQYRNCQNGHDLYLFEDTWMHDSRPSNALLIKCSWPVSVCAKICATRLEAVCQSLLSTP